MFANEVDFEVAVPNAGYEWVRTPLRGEHYLREAEPDGIASSGVRRYRPDADFPALFLKAAELDPESLDDLRMFANEFGQIETLFDTVTGTHPEFASNFFNSTWMRRAFPHQGWRRAISQLRHAVDVYAALLDKTFDSLAPSVQWVSEWEGEGACWIVRNHRELTADQYQNWHRQRETVGVCSHPPLDLVRADVLSLTDPKAADRLFNRFGRFDPPPGKYDDATLAEHFNRTPVRHPELGPQSPSRLVLDAWLDGALGEHLNGSDLFESRFGRHPRTRERCMMLIPKQLRSLLWLQFARAVMAGKDFTNDFRQCKAAGCGEWFALTPKERSRRVFCSDACKVRHFRDRKESAEELKGEGWTAPQIAKELDANVTTVRKWLQEAKSKGK